MDSSTHVFRVWNLRDAAWASDQRHIDSTSGAVKEKCQRVLAADPKAREWARTCLIIVREDEQEHIDRRQLIFDNQHPWLLEKRRTLKEA